MKRYCWKNKWLLLGALLFGILFSVFSAYISIILKDVIDTAVSGDNIKFLDLIWVVSGLLATIAFSYYVHSMCTKRFIIEVIRSLRRDVFANIFRKNHQDFSSVNTADYISTLTNDIKMIEDNYFVPLFHCLNNMALFISAFIIMISLSALVTLFLVVSTVLMIILPTVFRKLLQQRQVNYSKKMASMTIQMKDFLSGYQIIRSYQMRKHVNAAFSASNDQTMQAKFAWDKINSLVESLSAVLGMLVQFSVLFLSAYLILRGDLTAGSLVALVQVSGMIASPIQIISGNIPKIQGTKLIIAKLNEHIHYQSSGFHGESVPSFTSAITLERVSFAYQEGSLVLQDVHLSLEKNKKYALIGKSGCGKTTLINLLSGNHDTYQGKLCYDGIDLQSLDIEEITKMSAIIHQGVYMFDDSIIRNIDLYQDIEEEKLAFALQTSGVASFLHGDKDITSQVGENGSNLSGGQRQRVAVARALVQEKPILILDEGTSAVDMQTAYDIESKLIQVDNLTILTITHSLNAELLSKYDEIIFMDDGHIVEKGTFHFLLKQKGAFYGFYHLKTS